MLIPAAVSAAQIPDTLGWYQIPNTKLRTVCAAENGFPEVWATEGCSGITADWSSGVFDTKRNRLIITGGGHDGYAGNELYALDLNNLTMTRLTDPGLPLAYCTEFTANGTQPASRHTYDGLAYMPNVDRLFMQSGYTWCNGSSAGVSDATWTFDFATNKWQLMNPNGTTPDSWTNGTTFSKAIIMDTAYDPNTGKVFVDDLQYLYSYDLSANSYTRYDNSQQGINYHTTAVIDPKRKKFVMLGAGDAWIIDIGPTSTYAIQPLTTSGGSAIINSDYPGLAYDPVSDRIVAWNGGNTVYSLNLDTNVWTSATYTGGPAAMANGTYKRWSYSPALNLFVSYNSVDSNGYAFRLTPASGSSDTTPPTVSLTAPSAGATVSGTSVTVSANASDDVGVVGVQFNLDGNKVGSEDTAAPYAITWDSTTATNGSHALTALARDATGNATTSAAVTVTVSNTTPPPPSSGLTAAYSFDAGSGSTLADASGNNFTGTILGATWDSIGKFGQALAFNGTSDKVSIASSLGVSLPMTIEAWVSPTNYADWRAIFSKRSGPGSGRLDMGLSMSTGSVYLYTGSAASTFTYSPPLNTWTHLAVVADATGTMLYVNGTLNQTLSTLTLGTDTAAPVALGNTPDSDDPFAGKLDELRLYARALTQVEIQSDMNTPVGGSTPPPSDATPPTVSLTAPASGVTVSGTSVAISANASDNVGVVGVQFKLDGNNLGAEDASSPYSISWNSTTATNGSHSLTALARDAAGNSTISTAVSVTVSNVTSPPTSADADFQARCVVPGVILCKGFDSVSDFNLAAWPNSGLYPGNSTNGTMDTINKASGLGSLKFTIPGRSDANAAGFWRQYMNRDFKAGETFYVQFRQLLSPEMLTVDWSGLMGTSWKQAIFHGPLGTCADVELTTGHRNSTEQIPTMYTECGSRGLYTNNGVPPSLLEQGNYNCAYGNVNQADCFFYPALKWMTFYYQVSLGNWGQPNSTIQAWVALDGQPYKQWINLPNFVLNNDSPGVNDYSLVTLLPYMTGKDSSINHPTAYTWYDELIISTKPIAAPGATGLRGDLDGNGAVDLDDLRMMIFMLVGTVPKDLAKADLDGDGQLLLVDLQLLVRILVGIP